MQLKKQIEGLKKKKTIYQWRLLKSLQKPRPKAAAAINHHHHHKC